MHTHRSRPATAPPAHKSSHRDESGLNSIAQSTSTTKIIKRQFLRSSRPNTHRNNIRTNRSLKSPRHKYKSSQDIRELTKGLLLDILPNKFRPLHNNENAKVLQRSKSAVMHKISATKPNIKSGFVDSLDLQSSLPLSSRSKKSTLRPLSAGITKKRKKLNPKKKLMTPYEKYTFMDEVHGLFFKLQTKEKEKQRLLAVIAKNESEIEIEEGLRADVLNESLRQFPNNKHVVLTRAESNWLLNVKNIKDLYHEALRDAQSRISIMNEFYTTARSTKIKECVMRLTQKAAKLKSKLTQHLKSLQFDHHEMHDISQQITDFEDMINAILDIELLTNNSENKMDIIEREIKLQTSLNGEYEHALNGLADDLQRIYQNDDNIDKNIDQIFNIQSELNEIQHFCAKDEEHQDNTEEHEDYQQLISPRSKSSKHHDQDIEDDDKEDDEDEDDDDISDLQNN